MPPKIVNIAKNTSYYTLALVVQKIISFSYFVIIARALGPEDLGKYYFALSFTTIFAVFIDLGLSSVLTRETAKTPERAQAIFSNILSLKIPLALVTLAATWLTINLLGYPELARQLVYLSSVCMILDSFTLSFFAISRGFHNLSFESISSVVFQLIVLGAGLVTLRLGLGIRALMAGLALASIFNFIYSLFIVRHRWRVSLRPRFDPSLIRLIIGIALPFALFGIFQRVYMYLDTVLLSYFSGDREVGIYQVAFKIIFALQFLPMAFSASLYPAFATYWANNRTQLAITFERAMNYLIVISLPIAVGIMVIADKLVVVFRSGYADSVLPLRLSMAAVVFNFLMFGVGALLNACDRQKINTIIMAVVTVVSTILNLLLIPRYGAAGASLTVAITTGLSFFWSLSIVPQITRYNYGRVLKIFFKALIAASLMAVFAQQTKNMLNLFIVVPISGIIYFAVIFLLGGFKKEDLTSIVASFRKKAPGEMTPE
jgi:O-antigen/teichoic acid export membrane protein